MIVERETVGWVSANEVAPGDVFEDGAGDLWVRVRGPFDYGKMWAVRLRDGEAEQFSGRSVLPRNRVKIVVEVGP